MTKQHSANSVAARARLRMLRGEREWTEPKGRTPIPRTAPDFTINIRSRSGERVQFSVTRYGSTFITSDGVKSARSIARGLEMLLRFCTP